MYHPGGPQRALQTLPLAPRPPARTGRCSFPPARTGHRHGPGPSPPPSCRPAPAGRMLAALTIPGL